MKKVVLTLCALFASQAVFADEIILKDKTVLKGTVIQVTDSVVEYDPEGPATYETVSRDNVAKIIYSGGREQTFQLDAITLTNGDVIKCSITKVTKDEIVYRPDGAGEEKTISRDQVARLDFSDGRSVEITKKTGAETAEKKEEPGKKPVGGYHKSIFRLSAFGGGGALDYGTIRKEQRVFRLYKPDLTLARMDNMDYAQYTGFVSGGAEIDLMLPAISFAQKRGFDFTGIKFGVKGRYGYEEGISVIVPDDPDEYHGYDDNISMGRLLRYHYWTAGPSISFIFSPRNNVVNFLITMYGTAGQVFSGKLNPATSLRDTKSLMIYEALANSINLPSMAWVSPLTLRQLNSTSVKGYTFRVGFGPEVTLNKYFPLVVGFHVTYANTTLIYGKAPLIYGDGRTKSTHHEVGGEISIGVHI